MVWKCSILILIILISKIQATPPKQQSEVHSINPTAQDEEYRLPESVLPKSYDIKLIPDLVNFTFDGEITMIVVATEDTETITFHIDDLEIDEDTVKVTDADSNAIAVKNQVQNEELNFYTLTVEESLRSGQQYQIYVKYHGYLRDDMEGFYRSSYKNKDGEDVWLASTQFEPTAARRAFPCFDEPAMKALFKISICHTVEQHAVFSNMPLKQTRFEGECTWSEFEETPMVMSSYLVAFVVSDFDSVMNGNLTVFLRPGIQSQAKYSASIGPSTIKVMENFTGVPYFLPKMTEVAVPDFSAGAMENWALVTYRERLLLFEEGISASSYKQSIATTVAHEFAHQWFGDLVGPRWWKYLWLNEGFATYFEFFATDKVEPDWRLDEQFVVRVVHSALSADSSTSTHPMTHDVFTPTQINSIFDSISYDKAGSVIRMMEHILSHETFRKGLKNYLIQNGNSTAEDTDLFAALKAQYREDFPSSDLDIEAIFKSWAHQSGYPIVNVVRDYDSGSIKLTQSRFLMSGTVTDDSTWWVPLTYATKSNFNFSDTEPKEWLNQSEKEKVLDLNLKRNEWVILNIQQTGYYRVNYDTRNWDLIIDYMNSDNFINIPPVNRAQLLDDAFTFVRADLLDYQTAFRLANYLARETDYIPWYTAFRAFSFINTKLKGLDDYEYSIFKEYVLGLLDKAYTELGFEENNSDQHITKLHRNQILTWACNFGLEDCIKNAVAKFDNYVKDPDSNYVEPDLQTVVYCNGLRERTGSEWDILWQRFLDSEVSTEQVLILGILGCTASKTHAHKYIYKSLNITGEIRSQDLSLVMSSVLNNANERHLVSFIKDNYEDVKQMQGVNGIRRLISRAASSIASEELYYELREFIEDNEDELGNAETLLQSAEANINWAKTHGVNILNWVKSTNYRLPTNIVPTQYFIELTPEFTNFTFDGGITIRIKVQEETDTIVLHASDMTIIEEDTSVVSLSNNEVVEVVKESTDSLREFHIIHLAEPLVSGGDYEVIMRFVGNMRDDMYGFYRSYYDVGSEKRWLAATQFQATYARRAFPCFDEPAFKATFRISIGRPKTYNSISNTKKEGESEPHELDDYEWDHFEETPPMSTYLVAFIVSDFVETNNGGKVSVWHQENAKSQSQYGTLFGEEVIKVLEDFTGMMYELSKMDQAAIPDFSIGAMENWGLVTYRERLLLFDEKTSTTSNKQSIATTIAHEFSHQWFGDLVSPEWWKFAWLNEGFATYFEYFAAAQIEKNWRLEEQFVIRELQDALAYDAVDSSHPMTDEVNSPSEASSIFDTISYEKAGSVIRMMKHILTEDTFRKGLQKYLNSYKYTTANADNLIQALHNQHKEDILESEKEEVDVTSVLNTWTTQKGYPLVTVVRDYTNNRATVTQERFLLSENPDSLDEHVYRWDIPLTYATKDSVNFNRTQPSAWLLANEEAKTLVDMTPSANDWVIFNNQQTGFYRVNYDKQNWNLITTQLNSGSFKDIHVLNRAQLLDDALNLARAGVLDYPTALDVTEYLSKEDDYIPWYSAFNVLSFLNVKLGSADEQQYQLFKDYILKQVEPQYLSLGFEKTDKDDHTDILLRSSILSWACNMGLDDCMSKSTEKFKALMANPNDYILDPDISSVVYCTALRHGRREEWDFLKQKYDDSIVSTEKVLIISALGCTANEDIINDYLQLTITEDSGLRKQDISTVFSSVYSNIGNVDIAFDFVSKNFMGISDLYGMGLVRSVLNNIASRMSKKEQYDKVELFIQQNIEELGPTSEQTLELILENIKWLETHGSTIFSWLQNSFTSEDPNTSTTEEISTATGTSTTQSSQHPSTTPDPDISTTTVDPSATTVPATTSENPTTKLTPTEPTQDPSTTPGHASSLKVNIAWVLTASLIIKFLTTSLLN